MDLNLAEQLLRTELCKCHIWTYYDNALLLHKHKVLSHVSRGHHEAGNGPCEDHSRVSLLSRYTGTDTAANRLRANTQQTRLAPGSLDLMIPYRMVGERNMLPIYIE